MYAWFVVVWSYAFLRDESKTKHADLLRMQLLHGCLAFSTPMRYPSELSVMCVQARTSKEALSLKLEALEKQGPAVKDAAAHPLVRTHLHANFL